MIRGAAVAAAIATVALATGHSRPATGEQRGALAPARSAGVAGPGLDALARRHPARRAEVLVQGGGAAVRAAIADARGSVVRELPIIDGLAARLPARAAAALTTVPGVRAVSLNAALAPAATGSIDTSSLVSPYIQSIHADRAWASGATGRGVGVAVIDTGIEGGLPDFRRSQADGRSRVTVSAVVNPRATSAHDTYGHGTHVAGLIAGNGAARSADDPAYGRNIGVAPDADLIAIKADDGHGRASVLDLIDGLQFAVVNRAAYNIRVINLSVRSTQAQSYRTDPLDAAVEAAWRHGIVVVAAAGNLGTSSEAVSYAPGNDPFAITVGAVDDQGTQATPDDRLTPWSSRGVTQDGFAKPDVLAPGAHMVAALAPGSDFPSLCPSCVVDGAYFRVGGTSMAAAVVSGAVADALSVYPNWTPDQLKASLMRRTRPVLAAGATSGTFVDADGTVEPQGTTDTTTVSQGEVALDKLLAMGGGTPEAPANQGVPLNQFVSADSGDIVDQTGSWSTGSWSTGSWSTGSWSTGSWSTGSWSSATGDLVAPWAQASFTGATLAPAGFEVSPADCTMLDRTGWSTGSWATSFDK